MPVSPRISRSLLVGGFGLVVRPLQAFLRLEAASGILLLSAALAALVWANLNEASYAALFDAPLSVAVDAFRIDFTARSLINDGLMTIFFFVVGMEIKRELVLGELNSMARAALPAVAALGGMVVPSAIFLLFNAGAPGQNGWGIPMATDIAFCVGVLTLLKQRVPHALVVFVTALAIFDDIGGILVIAIFYGHALNPLWLAIAAVAVLGLVGMNRRDVTRGLAYVAVGGTLWYALHAGGIHATISGVVAGLAVPAVANRPARDVLTELAVYMRGLEQKPADDEFDAAEILMIEGKLEELQSPLQRFVQLLHPWVAFVIMPLFALANAGVSMRGLAPTSIALGAALGLLVGKPMGILGFTLLATRLGLAPIPGNASAAKLVGVSIVAGIGFTVALFIAALAYPAAEHLLAEAKLGVLMGSILAGVMGYLVLRITPVSD